MKPLKTFFSIHDAHPALCTCIMVKPLLLKHASIRSLCQISASALHVFESMNLTVCDVAMLLMIGALYCKQAGWSMHHSDVTVSCNPSQARATKHHHARHMIFWAALSPTLCVPFLAKSMKLCSPCYKIGQHCLAALTTTWTCRIFIKAVSVACL